MHPQSAVHRTILVVDVEGFGDRRRTNPHQVVVRAGLYRALRAAFEYAGISWDDCRHEDRGDGVFVLASPEVPKACFVETLPAALVQALRRHNRAHSAQERIRLRMVLHAGEVTFDDHGVTAASINLAFRLLDAAALKAALADSPGMLALITSGWFFEEVVRHSPVCQPATYRPVRVAVKETIAVGWICLPDHPYPLDDTCLEVPPAGVAAPVPRQLPAPPRLFTGRAEQLTCLTQVLSTGADAGASVVISAIGGMGGIGKTWLALHWAHQNLDRFPDGQLYVNLRGFDPSGEPMPSDVAVRGFLDAFGVDPAAIPADLDAQAALYRSLVAGRRMLIVLDNARDTEHVTTLLPGSPSCTVLVTSRHQLSGLIIEHGAHLVDVDMLTGSEARRLLTRHLGRDQVAAESAAVDRLLKCCAGLPLAISIVAARLNTRPTLTADTLATRLRSGQRLLAELSVGERSVASAFTVSYQSLSAQQRRMFRLLGLHPGPDIDVYAATALTDGDVGTTERVLESLVDVYLLEQPVSGRYRLHDLLRQHARHTALQVDSDTARRAALTRLVDHYLHTAKAADRLWCPHRPPIELGEAVAGFHPHPLPDPPAALEWLIAEHPNLLAAQHLAADRGWHVPVWQLAWVLTTYHYARGHAQNALTMWRAALTAADQLSDSAAQTLAHRVLGQACSLVGRQSEAVQHLRQALALAEHTGDISAQAHTCHAFAFVWEAEGDDQRVLDYASRALRLFRTIDEPVGEAETLRQLGWCHVRLGHHEQARTHCAAALTLFRRNHYREGQAAALDGLGYLAQHAGQHAQALDHYREALALYRDAGLTYCEADTLDRLGHTQDAVGRRTEARHTWRQALALYQAQHRTTDADRIQGRLDTLDDTPCEPALTDLP